MALQGTVSGKEGADRRIMYSASGWDRMLWWSSVCDVRDKLSKSTRI